MLCTYLYKNVSETVALYLGADKSK